MGHTLQSAWKTIWINPRTTIREIISTNPKYMVLLLSALAGIGNTLSQASSNYAGETFSLPWILAISVIVGPLIGILWLYIISQLVYWTGRLLGGKALRSHIRTVYAWSNVPIMLILILWIPQLILFQEELFTELTPRMDANIGWYFIFLGFILIELILGVWSFIIYLVGLSEVQQFSKWKAFLNLLLSGLPIVLGVIVLVIIGIIISMI